METRWISVDMQMPDTDDFAMVSIRQGDPYHKEVMKLDLELNQRFYQSGLLRQGCSVLDWKEAGSTFLG